MQSQMLLTTDQRADTDRSKQIGVDADQKGQDAGPERRPDVPAFTRGRMTRVTHIPSVVLGGAQDRKSVV